MMKKNILILGMFLSFIFLPMALADTIEWNKTYTHPQTYQYPSSKIDFDFSTGDFAVGGYYWDIAKYDENGDQIWLYRYNISGQTVYETEINQNNREIYYVGGTSQYNYPCRFRRFDTNGNLLAEKTEGLSYCHWEHIETLSNNDFIANKGWYSSKWEAGVGRYDNNGNQIWFYHPTGTGSAWGESVAVSPDEKYVYFYFYMIGGAQYFYQLNATDGSYVGMYVHPVSNSHIIDMETDPSGDIYFIDYNSGTYNVNISKMSSTLTFPLSTIWSRNINVLARNSAVYLFDLEIDVHNNIIAVGEEGDIFGDPYIHSNAFMVKYDSDGNLLFTHSNDPSMYDTEYHSVTSNRFGNYITMGMYPSPPKIWYVKYKAYDEWFCVVEGICMESMFCFIASVPKFLIDLMNCVSGLLWIIFALVIGGVIIMLAKKGLG